ncbi:integrase [Mesorhizobium sp. L103C119B0]|nr:integrase [Mesorhizobium sp. L103C119B0]
MRFAFIARHRNIWPVAWLCSALDVSRSGFHAWLNRSPSARSRHDEILVSRIDRSFKSSDRTYGSRRVWHDVLAEGLSCGLHRIERLMRENGLRARPRRRGLPKDIGERAAVSDNLLDRAFEASAPNQKWIADFTYIWTAEGWLYVAAVIDLFSRRVVGWAMKAEMTAQLVTDALIMAIWRRGKPDSLLHHSDQGSQGGFKRSSQHSDIGGCDDYSKAAITPIWTSAVAITWTAARSGAIRTSAILVGDCPRDAQRECCVGGRHIAACRSKIVAKGRRYAPIDVQIFGQAALRPVSLFRGT